MMRPPTSVGCTWEIWGTAEYTNNFPKAVERAPLLQGPSPGNSLRNWTLLFLDDCMQYYQGGPASPLPAVTTPTVPLAPLLPFARNPPG